VFVLGISAFYHDSAAALVEDGDVVAAVQLERLTRKKHDSDFPGPAVADCLDQAGISLDQVAYVGFYDKPLLTFDRLLETYLGFAPRGFPSFMKSIPVWVKEKVFQHDLITKELEKLDRGKVDKKRVLFGFHHHSHAASAFYPSPFEEAAILVMDGVGEWATTTLGVGSDCEVELLREIRFPHSLGMLYSAFTYYLGFKVNDGEYKMMGLAPYGEPKYVQTIHDNLIDVKEDGSFRMNMDYFNYCTGLTMTNDQFGELFGGPARKKGEPLTQHHMDIAASAQAVTKRVILRLCDTLHKETGRKNLCMAGGVALNCVVNGQILREGPFERIWIQPAAGDAGGAVGVAQAIAHTVGGVPRRLSGNGRDGMHGGYLGPRFDESEIRAVLDRYGAAYHLLSDEDLFPNVARALADEKVVGWFQGRMEFGPRALGNRSILGDPRSTSMQRVLNLKIKYRESFRPFAPAVLCEDVAEYFEMATDSPYMLLVAPVRQERRRTLTQQEKELEGFDKLNAVRSDVPAITHVDDSARIQTVHPDTNRRFHTLLETFKSLTGCGVLVNTSFNVAEEPIVCTPEDAFKCFLGTEMDVLVLENILLYKGEQ
jgi:carbamoyltransferase